MKGAREYCELFETGQYGKLFIETGSHARGKTFHIWIVPEGESFDPRYGRPYNPNAVEVYGVIGGNPGWTENYGWLHEGQWCEDFAKLVEERKAELNEKELETKKAEDRKAKQERERVSKILNQY